MISQAAFTTQAQTYLSVVSIQSNVRNDCFYPRVLPVPSAACVRTFLAFLAFVTSE